MIQPFIKTISVSLLFLLFSGCVSVKIKAHPDYLGYYTGETILFSDSFQGISRNYSDHLVSWTGKKFEKNLPLLLQLNYQDTDFMARQWGISINDIDVTNPKQLKFIYEKVGINYMIINQVSLSEYGPTNFDDSTTYSATLRLQLIDFKNGVVIWKSDVKVNIGSLIIMDDDQPYSFNFSSSVSAFDKAYRKSIKRLIKSFHLIQVK